MLDLSSFEKAVSQLKDSLAYCESDLAKNDSHLALHLRAGSIQAFEFTYESAYKMLKRFLEMTEASPAEIGSMTFNQTIRLAYDRGLISAELREWKVFRENRNVTSHTYNEAKAEDVFAIIPAFLAEAFFIVQELKRRMNRE